MHRVGGASQISSSTDQEEYDTFDGDAVQLGLVDMEQMAR